MLRIEAIELDPHDHRLFKLLGEISREEDGAGRGMLSVIVVHKTGELKGYPGDGFFKLAEDLGRDISNMEKCWMEERNKVYDYWKSS